jgi:GlcNAc-P-P-Und epimerase
MDKNHKILVLGAAGFIGTNIVEQYLDFGSEVIGIDIKRSVIKNKNYVHKVECIFEHDFSKYDGKWTVIHLAARTDLNGVDLADYRVNFTFPESLIDFVKITVSKFIYFSSQLVHGYGRESQSYYNANTFYGTSKALGESIVLREFLNSYIVRPSSVWGPYMSKPYIEFFQIIKRFKILPVSKSFEVPKSFYFVGNIVTDLESLDRQVSYLTNEPVLLTKWMALVGHNRAKKINISRGLTKLIFMTGSYLKVKGLNLRRYENMTTSTEITEFIELTEKKMILGIEETWRWYENK